MHRKFIVVDEATFVCMLSDILLGYRYIIIAANKFCNDTSRLHDLDRL